MGASNLASISLLGGRGYYGWEELNSHVETNGKPLLLSTFLVCVFVSSVYNGFLALALPQTPDGQAAGVLVHMWRAGPGPLGNTAQHVWLLLKQGG